MAQKPTQNQGPIRGDLVHLEGGVRVHVYLYADGKVLFEKDPIVGDPVIITEMTLDEAHLFATKILDLCWKGSRHG
ncbi:MAG: hypothetical protein LC749_13580 [Actinobacteria bacterium]|nr:hypothetical protein [Actinomycetota bacterium]